MRITYRDFSVHVWIDDDTSHAQMLRGRKGPERFYCDIDPIKSANETRSTRLSPDLARNLGFVGTEEEVLTSAARWWIDALDEFEEAVEAHRTLGMLRRRQQDREAGRPLHPKAIQQA